MDMEDEWVHNLRAWAAANGNVSQLWLFGSRADGTAAPDSDVDLGIGLMPPNGDHDWAFIGALQLQYPWEGDGIRLNLIELFSMGLGYAFVGLVLAAIWNRVGRV